MCILLRKQLFQVTSDYRSRIQASSCYCLFTQGFALQHSLTASWRFSGFSVQDLKVTPPYLARAIYAKDKAAKTKFKSHWGGK